MWEKIALELDGRHKLAVRNEKAVNMSLAGMTQQAIAKELGVNQSSVSRDLGVWGAVERKNGLSMFKSISVYSPLKVCRWPKISQSDHKPVLSNSWKEIWRQNYRVIHRDGGKLLNRLSLGKY